MQTKKMILTSVTLAAMTVALGACSTGPQDAPANFDQRMRASVETIRIPLTLPGDETAEGDTSNTTYEMLYRFLAQTEAGYADTFYLDIGTDVPATRIAAITSALQRRGLNYVGTGAFGNAPRSTDMVLYLERSVAMPPECGIWPDEKNNSRNNLSSYHGCSMVRNLALMVADPRDLLSGVDGNGDPETATNAIVRRRTQGAAAQQGQDGQTGSALVNSLLGNDGGGRN